MISPSIRQYITKEQVEKIKKRCRTETLRSIGKSLGLAEQRVGEVVKYLAIVLPSRRGIYLKPFEALYHILVTDTKRRSSGPTTVELSYEQFLKFTKVKSCHYCGEPLYWSKRVNRGNGPTCYNLDRKDNTLGYTKKNCVVCCHICNRTKGNLFTYKEFLLLAPILQQIRERRKV